MCTHIPRKGPCAAVYAILFMISLLLITYLAGVLIHPIASFVFIFCLFVYLNFNNGDIRPYRELYYEDDE